MSILSRSRRLAQTETPEGRDKGSFPVDRSHSQYRFVQTDLTFEEFDPDAIVEIVPPAKDEDFADDTIFITAETMPSFQDGDLNTFRAWVMQNVKFPQVALENRIQGRVVLSFVIDKDGRLTNIEVLQSPDRSLSEEAIRVLNKSPKWSPGKQRNQAVRVKYTLPVDFRVTELTGRMWFELRMFCMTI